MITTTLGSILFFRFFVGGSVRFVCGPPAYALLPGAGCILFSRLKGLNIKDMLDLSVPGYSIFHAFGRIGCFFAGCCYGKISTWGVPMQNEPGILRIPVQLIESFTLFLLFGYLISSEKRRKNNLFKRYIICYATCRFLLEFLRGDVIRGRCLLFSTSQWISLLIFLAFCFNKISTKIKGYFLI